MAKIYAVKNGRKLGLFNTWAECEEQVKGFRGALYKSFTNEKDAFQYLDAFNFDDTPVKSIEKPTKPSFSDSFDSDVYACYTDGSYSSNHATAYGWAFVIQTKGNVVFESYGVGEGDASSIQNVAGELAAVMRGVKWAKENNCKVHFYYDYEGIEKWVTGDWKSKNDFTKAYVSYMEKNSKSINGFTKVAAHTGIPGNERADALASKALKNHVSK